MRMASAGLAAGYEYSGPPVSRSVNRHGQLGDWGLMIRLLETYAQVRPAVDRRNAGERRSRQLCESPEAASRPKEFFLALATPLQVLSPKRS
jgi:hypothetical protein